MAKRNFTIEIGEKTYKCYLDEDGRVFVLDDKKNPRAVSAPTGIKTIKDAREAAESLVNSLSKKRK
jgi:hypothetical protein